MIRMLSGITRFRTHESIVLDVQGVGYEVFVPVNALGEYVVGQSAQCVVYTHVREESLELFGFPSEDERELFILLLSVSGVGPKTALAVLGRGAAAVIAAIQQSDVAFFQGVPRLGKKTAQKLILELQSKVGQHKAFQLPKHTAVLQDVADGLRAMGYEPDHWADILNQVQDDWAVEHALKWVLQEINRHRLANGHGARKGSAND